MENATGNKFINNLRMRFIDGRPEAVNELLHFALTRIPDQGFKEIWFRDWKASVTEIEPELLTELARKAILGGMKEFWI